ncbi:hypothetical protein LUZ63_006337 [Rhynchospora breviuscula]|uniref:RRM domain-containing protein n=1 Tax=Rhynchospora breviuscula TaxID=2022672 RepID=A0A9Q0CPP3_9POAL|nr:hypothetical protein LUZ63_006337 [Rhynchospora breviuscula]
MSGKHRENDGASPAKIFVGGLPRETREDEFRAHFGKYGTIIDAVIMKDRFTQKPRGFGFITYDDPAVVDTVIEDIHSFHGKEVEIKRTIPKGAAPLKDFKTKKIFVGGLPSSINDDEFREFFSKFGKVTDHEIIRDHATSRPRGFGFIVFDSDKAVDDLFAKKGNMIDLNGSQVEIKKAEPKKNSSNQPSHRSFGSSETRNSGSRPLSDGYEGYGSYSGFGGPGGLGPYNRYSPGAFGSRPGASYSSSGYGSGYGSSFGGDFGSAYGSGLGGYSRGDSSLAGYSSRYGSYGGATGFGSGYGSTAFGSSGYGRDSAFDGTGSSFGGGSSYDSSIGGAYASGGGLYGSRGAYGSSGSGGTGSSRYHPYGR